MLKYFTYFIIFLILSVPSFSQEKNETKKVTPKFIGTASCAPCHKTEKQGKQMEIWEKSKHKNAYLTLKTEEADKIAQEKGFKTKAVDTEACLKCHASAYNVEKELVDAKFKIEDGVQCETCHGAASEYKLIHTKTDEKSKELAKEKGLIKHAELEKFCVSCHNTESPTFKEFNFEEQWKAIAHPLPKKN